MLGFQGLRDVTQASFVLVVPEVARHGDTEQILKTFPRSAASCIQKPLCEKTALSLEKQAA